jgi:hypothetical protein
VTDEQQPGIEVDVGPVQAEGFAFAHPGGDEQFEQFGEWVVDLMPVAQERCGFFDCPAGTLDAVGERDGGVAGRVVGQPALPDRVV